MSRNDHKNTGNRKTSPPKEEDTATQNLDGGYWGAHAGEITDDADSAVGTDVASSTASISSSILNYRTVLGRTFHSDRSNNNYWGANDEAQNNFLDIIHHVFTILLDNKLYLAPLPENVGKVLDLGTGTGIWAIDFADEHPEATVIGTDLSPTQPTWIPPNLSFQIDDYNDEWTFADNTFDYIHARWIGGTVPDWTAFYKKAYRALKPGGWLESFDVDGGYTSDDNSLTKALEQTGQIFKVGLAKLGVKASTDVVGDGLQEPAMKAAGFQGVTVHSYKIPLSEWPADPKLKEIGQFVRLGLKSDLEGSITMAANALGWTKDEISVYCAHYHRDLRDPKVHGYTRTQATYGQKPKE